LEEFVSHSRHVVSFRSRTDAFSGTNKKRSTGEFLPF
jgi:hypothetical protein